MSSNKQLKVSALALMGLVAAVGLMRGMVPVGVKAQPPQYASYEEYRDRTSVAVSGTFRNFQPANLGGHADFGHLAAAGGGRYANIAADDLAADGVPQFRSTGHKVFSPWRDGGGRVVMASRPYIEAKAGDVAGSISDIPGNAVTGEANFGSWFRNVDGVNTGERGAFTFTRNPSTGEYAYSGFLEGPSPSGSIATSDGDASTTYEIGTMFIHERGRGQFIEVATDADAWVYIDGRLVLDGGGSPSHPWRFSGISLEGGLVMENNSRIEVPTGSDGIISTNTTSAGAVSLSNSASIVGGLQIGPGGAPASVISGASRISGSVGTLTEPVPMPVIAAPTGLGDSRGLVRFDGATRDINTSFRCGALVFDGNNHVTVRGHVAILCDSVSIRNRTTIDIAPDSSLELYCLGAFTIDNYVNFNVNTNDPRLVTIYVLGTTPISLPNNATIVANFVSPNVGMTVGNSVTVIGGFYGRSLTVQNSGRFVVQTTNSGAAGENGDAHALMTQRIDLDRLTWLDDRRTYGLKMFFADRAPPKSVFNIRTNIDTLNLAVPPPMLREID